MVLMLKIVKRTPDHKKWEVKDLGQVSLDKPLPIEKEKGAA